MEGTVVGDIARPSGKVGFEEFCRRVYAPMVRLAYLSTGSVETAEDLVQDVLARTQRRYASVVAPDAYVRRAVVNACRSHHRRRRRELAYPTVEVSPASLEADELFDVLARLSPRMRAALVLRFYEDLPEQEIAELLGCAPGTARSLISRGLARLRTVLEQ